MVMSTLFYIAIPKENAALLYSLSNALSNKK